METNNWLIRALLYSHLELLSEGFWKSNEISVETQFCQNQAKNIRTKGLKNFMNVFSKLFVRYLQTKCECYLNKCSTVLVLHLSQIYFQNTPRFNGY